MTQNDFFTEQDIPYGVLQQFGLSQEMIDDLPTCIMTRLLSGNETPALPLVTRTDDGEDTIAHARLMLVRTQEGATDVCFIPKWDTNELKDYDSDIQQMLKNGKVTVAEVPGRGKCFVQFDDMVGQVVSIPFAIINQNISVEIAGLGLDLGDMETLRGGEPIEYSNEKGMVSMGVDLMNDFGLRITKGGISEWREEANANKLNKYNFGIYGCWTSDGFGNLNYIKEDDYTEDMEAEMQRQGQQRAARASMDHVSGGLHM